MSRNSEYPGLYKLPISDRVKFVKTFAGLTDSEALVLQQSGALSLDVANRMIENVIGVMPVPLGVATNFRINGIDRLIPMAIEEPSVVAAASNAARMARSKGGFQTNSTSPVMIGQIQVLGVPDPQECEIRNPRSSRKNTETRKRPRSSASLPWWRRSRITSTHHRHNDRENGYRGTVCGLSRCNGRERRQHDG